MDNRPKRYRILNVGPNLDARKLLNEFALSDPLISVEHVETGTKALDILGTPSSTVPDVIVIPFRLPIMTAVDYIVKMHSDQRLCTIPVFVWGPRIWPDEVQRAYKAGATCVLLGEFSAVHVDVLRQLCRKASHDVASHQIDDIKPSIPQNRGMIEKNVRLGLLFAGAGCISALFWVCGTLSSQQENIAFAPLPVYAALMSAGVLLMCQQRKKCPDVLGLRN